MGLGLVRGWGVGGREEVGFGGWLGVEGWGGGRRWVWGWLGRMGGREEVGLGLVRGWAGGGKTDPSKHLQLWGFRSPRQASRPASRACCARPEGASRHPKRNSIPEPVG